MEIASSVTPSSPAPGATADVVQTAATTLASTTTIAQGAQSGRGLGQGQQPTADGEAPTTSQTQSDNQTHTHTHTQTPGPIPTFDEILASLPADVGRGLTSDDINKLAAGDPDTVIRVLGLTRPDAHPNPNSNSKSDSKPAAKAIPPAEAVTPSPNPAQPSASASPSSQTGEAPQHQANLANANAAPKGNGEEERDRETERERERGRGIKRIYLGNLEIQQQRGIGDLVYAIRDKDPAKQQAALKALGINAGFESPNAAAQATTPAAEPTLSSTPKTPVSQSEAVTLAEARITAIQGKLEKVDEEYDTRANRELTLELIEAKAELKAAQKAAVKEAAAHQEFVRLEQLATEQAMQVFGEKLDADPAFDEALADRRDLLDYHNDPLLKDPEWPMKLARQVHEKLYGTPMPTPVPALVPNPTTVSIPEPITEPTPPKPTTQPQTQPQIPVPPNIPSQPIGAFAAPSGAGANMSRAEAEAAIANMSLEEVNRVMDAMAGKP